MGICDSRDDATKDIDNEYLISRRSEQRAKKLLLLGAGGSGKSTIFKQLKSIHQGMTQQERESYKPIVVNNIVQTMKTLVVKADELVRSDPQRFSGLNMSPESRESAEYVVLLRHDMEEIDGQTASHVEKLWKDPAIKGTFAQRSLFQSQDSAEYFFDQIRRVADRNYIPSEKDVMFARVRTTGIVEQEFTVEGNKFHVYDVGGQRNERRKWIHCFENVTAVLFISSLSAYDQMLYEDECTNRMQESLNLFAEVCNSRWFLDTSIILFLNKSDLFMNKIDKVSLTTCPSFSDYDGPNNYDDGVEFIRKKFFDRNQASNQSSGQSKTLYYHITNATDKNIVKRVFYDVQHILITASLQKGGLL